jgi:hypothetical protein
MRGNEIHGKMAPSGNGAASEQKKAGQPDDSGVSAKSQSAEQQAAAAAFQTVKPDIRDPGQLDFWKRRGRLNEKRAASALGNREPSFHRHTLTPSLLLKMTRLTAENGLK